MESRHIREKMQRLKLCFRVGAKIIYIRPPYFCHLVKSYSSNTVGVKSVIRTLTAKEIEGLHKMPTSRLIRKFTDIGVTDERLELIERDEGHDKPVPKVTGGKPRTIKVDPVIAENSSNMSVMNSSWQINSANNS